VARLRKEALVSADPTPPPNLAAELQELRQRLDNLERLPEPPSSSAKGGRFVFLNEGGKVRWAFGNRQRVVGERQRSPLPLAPPGEALARLQQSRLDGFGICGGNHPKGGDEQRGDRARHRTTGGPRNRKDRGMEDTNYLRDSLRAAAKEPPDTCTLCGAIINRSYSGAHSRGHG
jgi:hypothetical protein